MNHEDVIRRYFQAWVDNDPTVLERTFADNIIYSECYGPEYHGLEQIKAWFADWNRHGKVLEWTIKRVILKDNTAIAEWFFKCNYDGAVDGFDGVTLAAFDGQGKITKLSEFQSKAEHYFPYGE